MILGCLFPQPSRPRSSQEVWAAHRSRLEGLHHLAQDAVAQEHHRGPVLIGLVEGEHCKVPQLLHVVGSIDEQPVVPWPPPLTAWK